MDGSGSKLSGPCPVHKSFIIYSCSKTALLGQEMEMETHVKVIAWLYIIFGVLGLLAAFLVGSLSRIHKFSLFI